MQVQSPITRAWTLQQQWSKAANVAHERIERLRGANPVLLVLAAVVGAAAGLLRDSPNAVRALGVVGAVLLGAAGLLQQRFLGKARIADWIGTRQASEQLKSAVWRALGTGAGDESSRLEVLAAIEAAESTVALRGRTLAPDEIDPVPTVDSVADYRDQRAVRQADWHRNKATQLHRRSGRLRAAELVLTLFGIAASALAAAYTEWLIAPVIACITTIAAAVAAHLSATKYERIATGYEHTESQLDTLCALLPDDPGAEEAAGFVDAVERILADQNAAWLALLTAE